MRIGYEPGQTGPVNRAEQGGVAGHASQLRVPGDPLHRFRRSELAAGQAAERRSLTEGAHRRHIVVDIARRALRHPRGERGP
jgi:hypothetical protein